MTGIKKKTGPTKIALYTALKIKVTSFIPLPPGSQNIVLSDTCLFWRNTEGKAQVGS